MAPKLKVAFVSACDTDRPEFRNVAPEGTKMEDYNSRMKWVGKVAEDFHALMGKYPRQVEAELSTMAAWVGLPDLDLYPNEGPAR